MSANAVQQEAEMTPVLRVRDLAVNYGTMRAVSGVSFDLAHGQTLGIVGESGCGKSTLGRALVQMTPMSEGHVALHGQDLATLSPRAMRKRRLDMQMVFQDPRSSLHPKRTVNQIVAEPLDIWSIGSKSSRAQQVAEMLRSVGLDPDVYGTRRPESLSGGQCQRVAIARALIAGARVLVCDEPISSLDVSLRATVLNLLEELKRQRDLSLVFIAHDLAVVRNISDRILVMYLGSVVEVADSAQLFETPLHPYTRALIAAVPQIQSAEGDGDPLIIGEPPSPHDVPSGCRFRTRCPLATDLCAEREPELRELSDDRGRSHLVACHYAEA